MALEIDPTYTGPCYLLQVCTNDDNKHNHTRFVFYKKTAITEIAEMIPGLLSLPTFESARIDYYEDIDVVEV